MQTIQAKVNPRLLTKANRLFTGTVNGRIIEILQNARRAGATKVVITNHGGVVSIHDDGDGVDDFSTLLDMGGSGWDELDACEDPAGVGIFCLAPRRVTIRSRGKVAVVERDGWTGSPVEISIDPKQRPGTVFEFEDEPWSKDAVENNAVFTGLEVIVDNEACAREDFVCETASHDAALGCRIEVRDAADLNSWHRSLRCVGYQTASVLVNFHGQVVAFDYDAVSERDLHVLVDLTGDPTGIRLMLPARTQLIQNGAITQLKEAIQMEVYRYVLRRGHHTLPYEEYLYARQRGIDLPEATPTYSVGLLSRCEATEPVEVSMPEGFDLARCYRFDDHNKRHAEIDEVNAHLLAALGTFGEPFVPVSIQRHHLGYSWAELPTITKVEVRCGKQLQRDTVWSGDLTCVDSLVITVHTSDGKTFSSRVCMAVVPSPDTAPSWTEDHVVITQDAETRLCSSDIWHHLGGFNDEGDTFDTQEYQFERELDAFWTGLIGPDEQRRREVMQALGGLEPTWRSVRVQPNGHIRIRFADRTIKTITPTQSSH